MPTLTLKFKENSIKEFPLDKETNISIGRHNENDVVIDNLAVSGYHAKIDSIGNGFLLTDLQSKNGTFINGKTINSHYLTHNDTIIIGKHSLIFAYKAGESRPKNTAADMDQTMILDTGKYKEMMEQNAPEKRIAKKVKIKEAYLSIFSKDNEEVCLSKKITRIGKASDNDIIMGGLLTGKTAATISKRPGGYFLSYVDGMKKPKVNGSAVTESVQLKEFDIISIGSGKMQFSYKE